LAKDDFAKLSPTKHQDDSHENADSIQEGMGGYLVAGGEKLPKVRKELLKTVTEKFVPIGVLDQYQIAGVFVNWWDNIKYDLKTIMTTGWSPSLIPDEYMIDAFFQTEQKELETLEIQQSEKESELETTVENAIALLEYEADEDETINATLAKKELKTQIDYFTNEKQKPETAKPYTTARDLILSLEKEIKETKTALKEKNEQLGLKLIIKRFGTEDTKAESKRLLTTANQELKKYDSDIESLITDFKSQLKDTTDYDNIKKSVTELEKKLKTNKEAHADTLSSIALAKKDFKEITKRYNALVKDKTILQNKMNSLDGLLKEIGGIITEEEAKNLILKKHFDLINSQLHRYLNAEKRALVAAIEDLHDKYAVSAQAIEASRQKTMEELNRFLTALKYLGE